MPESVLYLEELAAVSSPANNMAQTPNFDVKNQFPAGELISGLQRKAEIENQQRIAEYNQKIQIVQTVVDGASKTVSGMVEYSKQRQRRDFINTLADSLSSNLMPNLNPGKSSLFPGQDLQTASYDPSGNAGMAKKTGRVAPFTLPDAQFRVWVRDPAARNARVVHESFAPK